MKPKALWLILFFSLISTGCIKTTDLKHPARFYDLHQQATLSQDLVIGQLQETRLVVVGEHHNNARHHQAQLKVIQMLHRSGRNVAIGLEMFRHNSQEPLDQWISGQLSEDQFKPIYLKNWNFKWELYRPIFKYAHDNRLPMVGLNVSRKITAQVARHGFESLSTEQKGALEGITCQVTPEYEKFIRKAYESHKHAEIDFNNFCEAQLVWDAAMAAHADSYLKQRPETVMVLLAGSGHARKPGIPFQLRKRSQLPVVVILPETRKVFDKSHLTSNDADYILLK